MAPSQKQLPLHEGQASCDTPEQYFSATKFTKDIDLSKHAEGIIKLANHHQELIYTDVPVAMGKAAFDHLSQSEESSGIRLDESQHLVCVIMKNAYSLENTGTQKPGRCGSGSCPPGFMTSTRFG